MTKCKVTCTIWLFFLEKNSEIWNAFTLFENWKVNLLFLSLISRMKSEMNMPWDRDREVKFLENSREILKSLNFLLFTHFAFCVLHLHFVEFLYCWFQICPQITHFTVNIQMSPQIACLFIWPFLSVSSNIFSKRIHCHNSRICQNTPHFVSNTNILYSQVNLEFNL